VKSTKPQAYERKKEKKETNTPKIVHPIRSNLAYSGGEIDLSNHYQRVLTKRLQMGYKKLAQELTKNKT